MAAGISAARVRACIRGAAQPSVGADRRSVAFEALCEHPVRRPLNAGRYADRAMRSQDLNSWGQTGVLHLWRYTENV